MEDYQLLGYLFVAKVKLGVGCCMSLASLPGDLNKFARTQIFNNRLYECNMPERLVGSCY